MLTNKVRTGSGMFWKLMELKTPFSRTWKVWKEMDFYNGYGKVLDFCLE